ncbi:MAG: diacylglycerol/lipid kinase family protein, partial [Tsuneonella sp.]
MPQRSPLPVIVNRSGGTAASAGEELEQQFKRAFAAADCEIALHLVSSDELATAIERHSAAPRLVVGGGDGTLATAAHIASARGGELAILPLGTRNHFARQLGVPLDIEGAAELA